MDYVKQLTAGMLKENAPEIKIGSTVKVHVKIREGERERNCPQQQRYFRNLYRSPRFLRRWGRACVPGSFPECR